MFLWLLSSCLGFIPLQNPITVVTNTASIPQPILLPTTAAPAVSSTGMPNNTGMMPGNNPNMPPWQNMGMPGNNMGMPGNNMGMPGNNMGMQGQNMGPPGNNMGIPGQNMGQPGFNMGLPGNNQGNIPFGNNNMGPPNNPGFLNNNNYQQGNNNMGLGGNNNLPGINNNNFNTGAFGNNRPLANQGNNQFANSPSQFAQINQGDSQVCDPTKVCIANPNSVVTVPAIDPRLGTTPSYMTRGGGAVNFPRQRRRAVFSRRKRQMATTNTANCACVPIGTCPANGAGNFGNGFIDFRIVTPMATLPPGVTCNQGYVYCCVGTMPSNMVNCGVLQQVPSAPNVVAGPGQASFGEFPWQVMILTNQNDYIAGGVLIDQLNVITVIHRLQSYIVSGTAPNVKVRLGEWDAAAAYEPIPFKEYPVSRVFTHPNYNPSTLQYDLAVIRINAPVPITPLPNSVTTINRACLPANSFLTYNGQRCLVAGWGKNAFGPPGNYQQILKKVDVPIVDQATCQTSLRNARLGQNYILDTTSFICAGGEVSKDSCTGDGGSGLVCSVNGQWTVIGLVSWGLGCASPGVPGVYVNIASLSDWIRQQQATM